MPFDQRFDTDIGPDATYGTCKIHAPVGIVRLVGEEGQPAKNGLCVHCWEETRDAKFFNCPTHGTNPKTPGKDGCPVEGCLGTGAGPSEEEVAREADAIGCVWPGGPALVEDDVAPAPARPPDLGAGGAGEGTGTQAVGVSGDGAGAGHERAAPIAAIARRASPESSACEVDSRSDWLGWRDPFLDP